jgi:hypothetical protein
MIVIFAPFVKFTREDDEEYALYCEHMYAKHKPFDHENPLWPAGEKPEDPYEIIELWEAFRETAFKSGDSSLEEEQKYLKAARGEEVDETDSQDDLMEFKEEQPEESQMELEEERHEGEHD